METPQQNPLFRKIKNSIPYFTKPANYIGGKIQRFFAKSPEYARKIDNTIQRVGNFLQESSRNIPGGNLLLPDIQALTGLSRNLRNSYTRAVKGDINQLAKENNPIILPPVQYKSA